MRGSPTLPMEAMLRGTQPVLSPADQTSAGDSVYGSEVQDNADVAPGIVGFLWALVFALPLWLAIGAALWYGARIL